MLANKHSHPCSASFSIACFTKVLKNCTQAPKTVQGRKIPAWGILLKKTNLFMCSSLVFGKYQTFKRSYII